MEAQEIDGAIDVAILNAAADLADEEAGLVGVGGRGVVQQALGLGEVEDEGVEGVPVHRH